MLNGNLSVFQEAKEEKDIRALDEAQKASDQEAADKIPADQVDQIAEESDSDGLLSQTDDAKVRVYNMVVLMMNILFIFRN